MKEVREQNLTEIELIMATKQYIIRLDCPKMQTRMQLQFVTKMYKQNT